MASLARPTARRPAPPTDDTGLTAIDRALLANERFAETFDRADLSPLPAQHLAVLTCMDVRVQVEEMLGLAPGDAHILRNAGGVVTDGVLRSLVLGHRKMGVREVMIVNHTRCGVCKLDEQAFKRDLRGLSPAVPVAPAHFHGFESLEENVREQVAKIRSHPWLTGLDAVRGFVYDVGTGRLHEVV